MGQKIRKLLNSEKGSITVLVVAAMLFMIVILALSFMGMSNKTSTQMSNIKQIEAEYASEQDIEQVYKETIETIDRVGEIVLTPNTTEWTNQDITVTVDYQKQLTEKRMAGVGSANTPNATSVIVTENATVFAEAYTKEGFKRKASLQIRNIDKVKPTAVIRTNGGSYVMPSSGEKAKIKTRVNVSDLGGSELNDIKYAWSQSKDAEPTSWQTFADGDTLTKNDCTVGTYYLWLNVTDHAGSRADTKVSNAFIVRDSSNAMDNITFKVEPDGWTNKDVKVTVIYGDNLTENRKAGPQGGELKANATIVTMTENGKVVAEAEDPAGNKVVAEITIDKIDKVPPVIKTVTNPSNGNWTNQNITVTLVAEDNLSGIKEFQWFENGEWTTRALTTSGNTGTITYTDERDTTIRFRVIDNAGNISEEKTTVIKIDKTAPTHIRTEVKNISTTGYDVYVYGVTDGTGSGVNRVQFPTWTNENWQDDIQSNWQTNASATGVKQADGTTWVYRVNVTDHKNEYGEYLTDIYAYDNIGNGKYREGKRVQVPGVVITFNANGGTVTEGTRTKGYASQMGTLPTPTRTGYTFTGWFTAATGGTKITDATTVPANNVTYYAQWTRDTYTISYNLNGGAITGQPTSYNVESNAITLPTPTKTGYTFTGWTGSNGTTPQKTVTIAKGSTGNKNYTANWTATNYTITYNLNGGTITGNPGNYNIESNEITLPTPTKTGYTFAGWTGSNGTTPQTTVKIPKGQTGNKTYTANWTANTYTLSYNANGGTGTMATDTVTFDQNYTTKANTFTRTGYTFKGWNEKADGTGTDWTSWIGKPWKWSYTRNVTLYAQWVDSTAPTIEAYAGTMMFTDPSFASGNNNIRVYNNSGNGTVTHTRKAMSDNPAGSGYGIEIKTTGTASPGHGGFCFGHSTAANKEYIARIIAKIPTGHEIDWASNAYGTGGSITALTSKAGTGKWQEYIFKVKCGSTGTFSTTNYFYVKGGSTATASAPVVWQVGYATIFDTTAWGTSNYIIYTGSDDGSGVVGYGVSANSTTEPTYTTCTATSKISSISDAKTANGKYYVWVKDAAGNIGKKEVSVNYVDRASPTYTSVEVKNLSTTGYDVYIYGVTDSTGSGVNRVQFPTWTDANGQDDIQSNWQTSASATGVRQADGTTWVYRVNVTDHKNEYGAYNTHVYLYDNLGNARSIAVTKPSVPGVTITFNANGGTVTEGTRTKGYASQIGTLPTPTRTGYTFNGWYTATTGGTKITDATTVPASNVTYYAQWTVNSYTVTYNYAENGGKSATKTSASVNYGSAIDLTPTAAKDGYNFVGWNTNKDATTKLNSLNMGAGNVTLYAIYSKTITGTFNYFNGTAATSRSVSQTVYNKTTQATIKAPTLENASKDSTTYTARGWSTSNAADATVNVNSGANVTLSSSATYYASYQATITATFYYHTGDNWTTTQSSATASATRFMNYAGTYKQSNIAVPSAVSSSAGYVSTTYKGVSNAKSSATLVTPSTASTAYYAVYNVEITYYYYNGSSHTSSTGIRTSTTNGSAYGASVNTEPKPTAYDGANFKWWSYSPTQISSDYQRTPAGTAEKSLYAVYEKSVTATFYYHTGDNLTNTQTSTTASGTKNYVSKSGGVNTYNGNISIPAAVTGSSTYLTTAYKGVANAVNSSTSVTPTTANTKYYAFYECSLTYYFYNGSAHTSSSTTRRARSNGTNYVCTVDSVPTPSAYDGAAFKWWSYDANQAGSDYKREPNATQVQSLYAVYQKNVTATFNYYNGTAAATATASATRSYISKSGGINTIQANIAIPSAVTGSKGVESTTYSHVSTSKTGSATTPNTATATYYAVYKKTVTATKYVYNNSSSTATGTAYAYYDGSKTNASINLGTTTPPSGYTARHWSTSNTANAGVSVALNGNASIMNNTTYYMSYSYSVTLWYNGSGASLGVPEDQSGTAYMNYKGDKVGATITLSTAKPTRANYTFNGWYTATSGGTKCGTSITIQSNTTIFAQWSGNVYTVTLNTQNATSVGSTAVYEKYGTGIYKELACTNQMTTSANAITKPSKSYTLTYNANGGTVSGTSTTASYTFGGYYTAENGGGDQLINANGNITSAFSTTKYSANGTLYAKWTRNSITLATPTRAGYVFKGWFTATSGGTQITSSTVIDKNQTIYAQWDKIIPIEIGDYINYTPDTTAQKVYSKNNLVENLTGSTNNSADITQDNLNWQVLRKYDDGSMDIIGSPTTQYIYFSDATGYNNGVYIMHDICEKLYSRTGIKARSVTLEDMDYWMTNTGKTTKNNYIKNKVSEALSDDYVVNEIYAGDLANNAVTYIKDYSYYPNLYASENGSGINTRTVKTNGITDTNKSTLDRTIRPNSYKQANNLTVTQTSYNMGITNINYGDGSKVLNNSNRYWIASRSVEIVTEEMYWGMNTSMAGFSLRSANTQMGGTAMFDSNCVKYSGGSYLRPVIHLGANVKITRSETASNAGTPHRITQY